MRLADDFYLTYQNKNKNINPQAQKVQIQILTKGSLFHHNLLLP